MLVESVRAMAVHSDDMIKAELVEYFIDDEKSYMLDEIAENPNDSKQQLNSGVPVAGNDSPSVRKTGNPPVQSAPVLPAFGLPVDAYPNYRNYLFWFTLGTAELDKEILFRNELSLAYVRDRTICAVLGLFMFFHLLLFHGYAVRWISSVLKATLISSILPSSILWFLGNIVTLTAFAVICRYVWTLLRQMLLIQQVLPLVLPNDVLIELELKGATFRRLFVPEESLRPSYFAETPQTNVDVNPVLTNTGLLRPNPTANDSFFRNLSAQRTPDISFSSRGLPSTAPLSLSANQQQQQTWKAPETPFSWLHLASTPKPQQPPQQKLSQLPRFMQDDYMARQQQAQAAEYNNLTYQAWQQEQSMLYNNSPSFNTPSPYYAGTNGASLLYPSPTTLLRSGARAPSPSSSWGFNDNDMYYNGDASMMSTSSASSSASRRSRTPSCLLHEHEKFDSVDRENVYNTYGYPAVERAFDSLKEIHNISPTVFYSSQFLGRLLASNRNYNAADQFDVPQTLNTLVQPTMQNTSTSPFGFLRHRRKQQQRGSTAMDTLDTTPATSNLPFDGLSLTPEEIWTLLGVTPSQLYAYTQNLKHWLLITVVRPLDALVEECDQFIAAASNVGQHDTSRFLTNPINTLQSFLTGGRNAAGSLSIRTNPDISLLRQALRAKPEDYRLLNNLIPFLEAFTTLRTSLPQTATSATGAEATKYALQRINLLSNAPGIMNNYAWDGSSVSSTSFDTHHQQQQTYAGIFGPAITPTTPGLWGPLHNKPSNMPNISVLGDALILFDTFRTFFDIIMAADPRSATGSFSYHYVLPPNADQTTLINNMRFPFPMLYQESAAGVSAGGSGGGGMPPNFQVFYEGKFLQPERGRNNLFHAILLFLVLLRNRFEDGRGAVWLGSAGSHIFDVFRADYREFMESILSDG